jgi:hypothetical protein
VELQHVVEALSLRAVLLSPDNDILVPGMACPFSAPGHSADPATAPDKFKSAGNEIEPCATPIGTGGGRGMGNARCGRGRHNDSLVVASEGTSQ